MKNRFVKVNEPKEYSYEEFCPHDRHFSNGDRAIVGSLACTECTYFDYLDKERKIVSCSSSAEEISLIYKALVKKQQDRTNELS